MKKAHMQYPVLPFGPRMIYRFYYPCVVVFLIVLSLLAGCQYQKAVIPVSGLTTLKVVMDNNYPPYAFLDQEGHMQGILVDRWRLWEKKTGIKVEITGLDWSEALTRMEAGEFDVIDTIFVTDARTKIYDFSEPYQKIEVPIYFNNRISGIVDVESLKGFTVAVKSNDAAVEYLLKHNITNLIEYNSYEDIIKAAVDQEVVVFVIDKPPADYFLYLYGLQGKINQSEPLYSGEFHRAVLKGNSALLGIIEDGFNKISEDEYKAIDQKWYGATGTSEVFIQTVEIIGAISLFVLLLLVAWNRSLQSQVKRKTKVLLESEQKFRQIFDNSAVGISLINEKGEFLSGNKAILKMLGYTQEEYGNLSIASITHPADLEFIEQNYREIWKGKKDAFTAEVRHLHKDGQYVWGRVTKSMVKDATENSLFAIGMFEDITEQKYSEKIRNCIFTITQATISTENLEKLFASIHQILSQIMPVENFYIALYDEKTNLLHFPFFIDQYENSANPIEPGHGLSDYVMRMRKPYLITGEIFDQLEAEGEVELIGARPVDWLGIPLIANDRVIGVLATQSYSDEIHFSAKDLEFLEFVSVQIAQAIELKRAEEALHLSELRYRNLFEDSPVSIWEEDFSEVKKYLDHLKSKGEINFRRFFREHPEETAYCVSLIKVIDVNKEALRLTRAKNKKELFANMDKILDLSHAEDFLQEIVNVAEGKTDFEWEGINKTLDGEPVYVSMRWAVEEGYKKNLAKVIVSLFDISSRKKAEAELHASEERYRNLVSNLGEGIVIIGPDTQFLFANPSANEIFGVVRGSLEQTKLNDFIKKDTQEFIVQKINTLKAGEANTFELEIVRRDGENRFVQIFARPQFDDQRNYTGTLGIIHDITDRKIAEEKRIERYRFEEMLTNISTRFINVENDDIDNEINAVLKHIGQFENVDRAYVFRIDQKLRTMSGTHDWCRDIGTSTIHQMQNLPISEFPWFIEQIACDPLIISRIQDLPDTASKEKRIAEKQGVKSMAIFPMWVNLELVGFVGFDALLEEHIWNLENTTMLQQFANIISNAIERSRLLKILEDRAIRDELTGTLNRRGFLQIANTELIRAHRYNHPIGMILLDMDHLKKVNDTYGHATGDLALQEIARFCLQNIRGNDVLGRWGGDEFVILLPESEKSSTINVATRLQQSISEHKINILGKDIQLSISAGVAMAGEDVVTIDELFRNADAALYLAKEAGRNRIKTQ